MTPPPAHVLNHFQLAEQHRREALQGKSVRGEEAFCAYLDLLGFREKLKRDAGKLHDEYKQAVSDLREYASFASASQVNDGPIELHGFREINPPVVFSDSFFICTRTTTPRALQEICHFTSLLFRIMLRKKLLLRGSISMGPLYWDIESGIHLGLPISEAYELAESMIGGGLILHPRVAEKISGDMLVSSGSIEVPLKTGAKLAAYIPSQNRDILPRADGEGLWEIWQEMRLQAVQSGQAQLVAQYDTSAGLVRALVFDGPEL